MDKFYYFYLFIFFTLSGGTSSSSISRDDDERVISSDNENTEGITNQEVAFPEDVEDGDEEEKVLNWGGVMKQTWFLVMDVKDITTGFGPTKILTLKNWNQETF